MRAVVRCKSIPTWKEPVSYRYQFNSPPPTPLCQNSLVDTLTLSRAAHTCKHGAHLRLTPIFQFRAYLLTHVYMVTALVGRTMSATQCTCRMKPTQKCGSPVSLIYRLQIIQLYPLHHQEQIQPTHMHLMSCGTCRCTMVLTVQ